jgi:hypothetical protein
VPEPANGEDLRAEELCARLSELWPVCFDRHGQSCVMEARSYWGRFYVLGTMFFVAAGALVFTGRYAPLVFATVNSPRFCGCRSHFVTGRGPVGARPGPALRATFARTHFARIVR